MDMDIRHNRTVLDALIPRLAPLQDLPPSRLQRLIDESSVLDYTPGHYVFRQGDRDAYLFYLLQGDLELYSDGELVSHLRGGTQEARFALAQLQPRQLSALPRTTVRVLRVQRERLDHLMHAGPDDNDAEPREREILSSGPEDWITRMLKSPIFARLPVANIQRLFAAMEAVEVEAGQSVIQQGQAADACYVIKEGLCEVQSHGYRWASAAGSPDPVSDDPLGGAMGAGAAEHSKVGSDDPEVQAAVLKARLAQARLELHEALRIKHEAEQAHAEEQAAKKRLEALADSRSQAELARAQALFAEAEAMRRDLEEARRRAEVEAERLARDVEARAAGLEAEVQQRLRERDQELVALRAMKEEQLATIQRLRAEAEAEVQADRERLAAEVREAEARVADTQRHQQELEASARRAEQAGYHDLQGEREHVKAERERANALVAEAEAMKRELERSKRLAEADALHGRREEEEG